MPARNIRFTKEAVLVLGVLLLALAPAAGARTLKPGDVDTNWGVRGELLTKAPVIGAEVTAIAVLPDGGAVVATASGESATGIVWLSRAGKVRHSMPGPDAWRPTSRTMVVDSRGRLLVAHGVYLWRYTPAGRLDRSFGRRGASVLTAPARSRILGIVESTGGTLRVGLSDSSVASVGRYHLRSLTSRGAPIRSFGHAGNTRTTLRVGDEWRGEPVLVAGPMGTTYTVGVPITYQPQSPPYIVVERRRADGALDTTFANDGRQRVQFLASYLGIADAALDRRGRLVVAVGDDGRTYEVNSAFARMLPSGAIDMTFAKRGRTAWVPIGGPGRLVLQPRGFRFYALDMPWRDGARGAVQLTETGRYVTSRPISMPTLGGAVALDARRQRVWLADLSGGLHTRAIGERPSPDLGRALHLPALRGTADLWNLSARRIGSGGLRLQSATGSSNQRWADSFDGTPLGIGTLDVGGRGSVTNAAFAPIPSKGGYVQSNDTASGETCAIATHERSVRGNLAARTTITRLTSTGATDTAFGRGGRVELDGYAGSDISPIGANGCVVLGERSDRDGNFVTSQLTSCRRDGTSTPAEPFRYASRLTPSAGGSVYAYSDRGIMRVTPDLALDRSFGTDGVVDIKAEQVVELPDGRLLVEELYGSNTVILGSDGARIKEHRLDVPPGPWTSYGSGSAYAVIELADGGFVVADEGSGTPCTGCPYTHVVIVTRYARDATVDRSFGNDGSTIIHPLDDFNYGWNTQLVQLDADRVAIAIRTQTCSNAYALVTVLRLTPGEGSGTRRSSAATDRADRVEGTFTCDSLDGGGGDDLIDGAAGADVITGGPGLDTIRAGAGHDQLKTRDGERDTVDCGSGRDVVTADRVDRVTNCEMVKLPT